MYFMKLCLCSTKKVTFMSKILTLVRKRVLSGSSQNISLTLVAKGKQIHTDSPEHGKVIIGQKGILQDS